MPRSHHAWTAEKYQQIRGAVRRARLRDQWIYHGAGQLGILGTCTPGQTIERTLIRVSPGALGPVLIHEALHAAFPTRKESSIRRTAELVYARLTTDEVKALVELWQRRAKRLKRPVTLK